MNGLGVTKFVYIPFSALNSLSLAIKDDFYPPGKQRIPHRGDLFPVFRETEKSQNVLLAAAVL